MKAFLNLRVHVQRWVVWWMVVGIMCGIVAITNILEHNLTRAQDRILIAIGIMNWLLGGLICYAFSGVRIQELSRSASRKKEIGPEPQAGPEWHAASDFLMPGNRKSLLPPRYR